MNWLQLLLITHILLLVRESARRSDGLNRAVKLYEGHVFCRARQLGRRSAWGRFSYHGWELTTSVPAGPGQAADYVKHLELKLETPRCCSWVTPDFVAQIRSSLKTFDSRWQTLPSHPRTWTSFPEPGTRRWTCFQRLLFPSQLLPGSQC